jgi:ATP-dependent Lon protease
MRDFRDAKAMAQTLREALKTRSLKLTHSESLEITAQMLGFRNWNVLAAQIQAGEAAAPAPAVMASPPIGLPVVPIRDIVVAPQMTLPLYVGRAKTLRAVERAMAGDQRVLVVAQRRAADDDPDRDALYDVGVIAKVLEAMRLPDGSMKVVVRADERVRITRLVGGELLQAEHEPAPDQPAGERGEALVAQVLERFLERARVDLEPPPQAMLMLSRIKAPGVLADLMVQHVLLRVDQGQDLLETTDPAERLEKLLALMQAAPKAA